MVILNKKNLTPHSFLKARLIKTLKEKPAFTTKNVRFGRRLIRYC